MDYRAMRGELTMNSAGERAGVFTVKVVMEAMKNHESLPLAPAHHPQYAGASGAYAAKETLHAFAAACGPRPDAA
jgi:hypothetical protein